MGLPKIGVSSYTMNEKQFTAVSTSMQCITVGSSLSNPVGGSLIVGESSAFHSGPSAWSMYNPHRRSAVRLTVSWASSRLSLNWLAAPGRPPFHGQLWQTGASREILGVPTARAYRKPWRNTVFRKPWRNTVFLQAENWSEIPCLAKSCFAQAVGLFQIHCGIRMNSK